MECYDRVIVDGGKPQLNASAAVFAEIGGESVSLASLAKREEQLFVRGWDEPVTLPNGSASLYLVKRIRDEAHRFAMECHRALRGRAMSASVLDDIHGVGHRCKKALLKESGSVKMLRAESVEELAAVPGVGKASAEAVVGTPGMKPGVVSEIPVKCERSSAGSSIRGSSSSDAGRLGAIDCVE